MKRGPPVKRRHRAYFLLNQGSWTNTGTAVRVFGLDPSKRKVPLIHIAHETSTDVDALEALCACENIPLLKDRWIRLADMRRLLRAIGWNEQEISASMECFDPQRGSEKRIGDWRGFLNRKKPKPPVDDDDNDDDDIHVEEDNWQADFISKMKALQGPEAFSKFQESKEGKRLKETMIRDTLKEYDERIRAAVRPKVEQQAREAMMEQLEFVVRLRFESRQRVQTDPPPPPPPQPPRKLWELFNNKK